MNKAEAVLGFFKATNALNLHNFPHLLWRWSVNRRDLELLASRRDTGAQGAVTRPDIRSSGILAGGCWSCGGVWDLPDGGAVRFHRAGGNMTAPSAGAAYRSCTPVFWRRVGFAECAAAPELGVFTYRCDRRVWLVCSSGGFSTASSRFHSSNSGRQKQRGLWRSGEDVWRRVKIIYPFTQQPDKPYPEDCCRWWTGKLEPLFVGPKRKSPLSTSGPAGRSDWPPSSRPSAKRVCSPPACWLSSSWSGSGPGWRRRCCTAGWGQWRPPPSRRRRCCAATSSWRNTDVPFKFARSASVQFGAKRLCRHAYLQLLVCALSWCKLCRQSVSVGVFIYSQNQADDEQGNTCCSKVQKPKGLVNAWTGAPNSPQSFYPILRRRVWACRRKHRSWRSWPTWGTCGRLPGPSRWRRPGGSSGARPPWRCTGRRRRRTRARSWARTSCSSPAGRLIGWWGSSTGSPDAPSCEE